MVLAGKPDEKKPTGRPKLRRKDNIKTDLQVVSKGQVRKWFWQGNLMKRDQLGDLNLEGKIISKLIFK